jgi:hypothetical protein
LIRDEADYTRHVEYCYINPLKHRLVTRVRDWPYSSFHRDVRAGVFPENWAAIAKRAVISANDDDRTAAGPARRVTPIGPRLGADPLGSNPPDRPAERASAPEQGEKRQYDRCNSQHNHRNLKPHIIPHQVEIALGCS